VPTPALVAPIEFTMRREDYAALGGHVGEIRDLASLQGTYNTLQVGQHPENPWPLNLRRGDSGHD
jgi:hypothetical protein